ncbi:MAG: DUF6537 domain-containing protein, partial [Shimia sp.]
IDGTHNVIITGVGGQGVVTLGAVLSMAAFVDGKGAAMMEMAGLAQKGGAVHIHCRIAETPGDITAVRVATGECDALIGGDLVVSAGAKTLGLMAQGRTGGVVNSHEIVTGAFTRDTEFRIPQNGLEVALRAKLQDRVQLFDASKLAEVVMGDTIFANMMVFGAAWQAGLLPISEASLMRALELNGAAVERNKLAFTFGRWAAAKPEAAEKLLASEVVEMPKDPQKVREDHIVAWGGARRLKRYRKLLDTIQDDGVRDAASKGFHKLLTYKDEYEVARLLTGTRAKAQEAFDGDLKLTYHLAPPMLPGKDKNGRPKKRAFGGWMARVSGVLARFRPLRGTPFDPFGYSAERRMERALVDDYERDMAEALTHLTPATRDAVIALALLPLQIRGFGPVKEANAKAAARRREELLHSIRAGGPDMAKAAE